MTTREKIEDFIAGLIWFEDFIAGLIWFVGFLVLYWLAAAFDTGML